MEILAVSQELLKTIRAFAFDIDGVFTNGGVQCDVNGELYRTFDSKDGFSIRMAVMHDYPIGIITGGNSRSITARFRTCGLKDEDVYLGSRDKREEFMMFCENHGLRPEEVAYVGDDLPDIGVIKLCGLGVCPCDACDEVLEAAKVVSPYPGGHWCVRQVVESVMKARGDWTFDPSYYKTKF